VISSADPADLVNRAFVDASSTTQRGDPGGPPDGTREHVAFRIALGGAVQAGNSAFTLISAHDTAWHTAVFSGEIEHDPADLRAIVDRYQAWLDGSESLIAALDLAESSGAAIEGADELRSNPIEARGVLVPDGEFFEGEALDRLASEAIGTDANS